MAISIANLTTLMQSTWLLGFQITPPSRCISPHRSNLK